MPNYQTHMFGGLIFFIIAAFLVSIFIMPTIQTQLLFQWLICTIFGALFPDIDTKSKIQRFVYIITLIVLGYLMYHKKYNLIAIISFLMLVPLVVNHRGIFHKPIFILFIAGTISFGASMINPSISITAFSCAAFFTLGALSHIFLDSGFKGLFRI